MENICFFAKEGEKGITETSAQHLCAIAAQLRDESEKVLNNVCFVDTKINIIGSKMTDEMIANTGMHLAEVEKLHDHLDNVAQLNALIAWFSEARKELERYKESVRSINLNQWAENNNVTIPKAPVLKTMAPRSTLETIISELSIKERQRYLALEAHASVIGKFIHKDSPMEVARQQLHEKIAKPYETNGEGRDTVIFHYTSSVGTYTIDKVFMAFQQEYRKIEQELNHMKSDLRKKLDFRNQEENNQKRLNLEEYRRATSEYDTLYKQIILDYNAWLESEETRMAKIKFAIPEALSDLIDKLNHIAD